ncbi:MAG: peroxidase [Opitutaceae bacterium]|nr:peroxidase [Verrucomicrobiales bacterium]
MSDVGSVSRLNYDDIQGLILRDYRMPCSRHFILRIDEPVKTKALLGALAGGSPAESFQIAAVASWPATGQPDFCLNVGITWSGLERLQPPVDLKHSFRSFPSFIAGAIGRADFVGDAGNSSPANWVGGLGPVVPGSNESATHLIVTLHARTSAIRESASSGLRQLFADRGAVTELSCFDGDALPGEKVHFGYRDGIARVNIDGGFDHQPDSQPVVPASQFVLLDDGNYNVPEPPELGLNGGFGAFRILEQDVEGFESFLATNSDGEPAKELLAAKIMGRWRNGAPLVLSPDAPQDIPHDKLNDFDYAPTGNDPGDLQGVRCPVGAHIRRVNPRGVPAPGAGSGHDHRLIRRGLPYGPPYVPGSGSPAAERGLLGMFLCADLFNQFEFVMKDWINGGGFMAGLPTSHRDPLVGNNSPDSSVFEIPVPQGPTRRVTGLGTFIRTRGAAYLFLPSLSSLRFIATH